MFDAEHFKKLLNQSLQERLPRLARAGESCFFVYGGELPIRAIAKGIASTLPADTRIVELASDYLRPGDGRAIVEPLLEGGTLVLVHDGASRLPGRLAGYWPRFVDNPRGYYAPIAEGLALDPSLELERPGALVVLQATPDAGALESPADIWPLLEKEAAELAAAGDAIDVPIATIGVLAPPSRAAVTFKDLCLLHGRDPMGTPRFPVLAIANERDGPLSWTDLQEVIRHAVSADWMPGWFHRQGRLDDERFGLARAAVEMLKEPREQDISSLGYPVFPDIYEVIWRYDWLDDGHHLFRGHLDARWAQDTSLLRCKANGEPADVGELVTRVRSTEAFLAALRGRQRELFGREVDEDSLLATAQHFGFPTPLLDYTRSLRIGAFFATLGASRLSANDRRVGVIYYMDRERREFGAGEDPAGRIGLEGFSLLDAARVRLGSIHVIEPDLPDADNRIARQSGVFIGGFQAADLQAVAVDRIYFRQLPGEEFEDPSAGITGRHLLPDDSPLAQLADEVKAQLRAAGGGELHPGIAYARIPERRVVGAAGGYLFAQVREASAFFKRLPVYLDEHGLGDGVAGQVRAILDNYFAACRVRADAGEAPRLDDTNDDEGPLRACVQCLAEMAEMDEDPLLADVERAMTWGRYASDAFDWVATLAAKTPLQRLACSCAMYLASWERLQHVDGESARYVALGAVAALNFHAPDAT